MRSDGGARFACYYHMQIYECLTHWKLWKKKSIYEFRIDERLRPAFVARFIHLVPPRKRSMHVKGFHFREVFLNYIFYRFLPYQSKTHEPRSMFMNFGRLPSLYSTRVPDSPTYNDIENEEINRHFRDVKYTKALSNSKYVGRTNIGESTI